MTTMTAGRAGQQQARSARRSSRQLMSGLAALDGTAAAPSPRVECMCRSLAVIIGASHQGVARRQGLCSPGSRPNGPAAGCVAGRAATVFAGLAGWLAGTVRANAGGTVSEPFSSAAHDFAPGAQMAGYKIVEEIGRGGMAVVYQARDTRLERWVALKILAPQFASDDGFRQRFIRESRAAAAVDHPNIIPIFDAGEADGVLYIAMRFVSGQDVHSLLRRTGPLAVTRVAGIISQIAAALDAAHARGLVHRDVKPANMLLTDPSASTADHVYLSDFGISKQVDAAVSLTSTGQLVGTLNYLAPEQIEGHTVDGRADQYALACSAYEMLAGEPPFKRDQSLAVIWAQLSASAPALTGRRPDLPAALDQIMARALAKSPADRYGTCGAMAASFEAACGLGPGDLAAGAAGGRASLGPARRRRSAWRVT